MFRAGFFSGGFGFFWYSKNHFPAAKPGGKLRAGLAWEAAGCEFILGTPGIGFGLKSRSFRPWRCPRNSWVVTNRGSGAAWIL